MRRLTAISVAGLFVTMVMLGAASTASAQTAPFTAYGSGLTAGATVEARVGGVACSSTTVDATGNWMLYVVITNPCAPKEGSTITFRLNGQTTVETATFAAGGAPANVAAGISLTVLPPPTLTGKIVPAGVSTVVFSGGYIEEAAKLAPNVISFTVFIDGAATVYIPGAPGFVNAAFLRAFPNGMIPANTVLLTVT